MCGLFPCETEESTCFFAVMLLPSTSLHHIFCTKALPIVHSVPVDCITKSKKSRENYLMELSPGSSDASFAAAQVRK
jgi:hypothetical protein